MNISVGTASNVTGNLTTEPGADTVVSYLLLAILGSLFCFILIANSFVLVCFAVRKTLRKTVYNLFICNLSFSDFVVGWAMLLSTLPFLFPDITFFQTYEVCNFTYVLSSLAADESTYQMTIISLSCLFSIVKPFSYKTYFSTKSAIIMMVTSWCIAVAHSSLAPFVWGDRELYNNHMICSTKTIYGENYIKYQETLFLNFFTVYPALVGSYAAVVYHLFKRMKKSTSLTAFETGVTATPRGADSDVTNDTELSHVTDSTPDTACRYSVGSVTCSSDVTRAAAAATDGKSGGTLRHRREAKAVKTLTLLFVLYSVSYIPFCVYHAITAYSPSVQINRTIQNYLVILLYSNSAINPVIYSLRLKEIRAMLKCVKR